MILWLFLRFARYLGFDFITMYAPGGTIIAIHFARDEVSFVRSINDWTYEARREQPVRVMDEERCESCRKVLGRGWKYDSAGEAKFCPRCYAELQRKPKEGTDG